MALVPLQRHIALAVIHGLVEYGAAILSDRQEVLAAAYSAAFAAVAVTRVDYRGKVVDGLLVPS